MVRVVARKPRTSSTRGGGWGWGWGGTHHSDQNPVKGGQGLLTAQAEPVKNRMQAERHKKHPRPQRRVPLRNILHHRAHLLRGALHGKRLLRPLAVTVPVAAVAVPAAVPVAAASMVAVAVAVCLSGA